MPEGPRLAGSFGVLQLEVVLIGSSGGSTRARAAGDPFAANGRLCFLLQFRLSAFTFSIPDRHAWGDPQLSFC